MTKYGLVVSLAVNSTLTYCRETSAFSPKGHSVVHVLLNKVLQIKPMLWMELSHTTEGFVGKLCQIFAVPQLNNYVHKQSPTAATLQSNKTAT